MSCRYTGSDTLDEPVSETIVSVLHKNRPGRWRADNAACSGAFLPNQMRDLRAIGTKIVQVLHPSAENAVLRDWDLWGPLIVSCCACTMESPAVLTSLLPLVLPHAGHPPLDKW